MKLPVQSPLVSRSWSIKWPQLDDEVPERKYKIKVKWKEKIKSNVLNSKNNRHNEG